MPRSCYPTRTDGATADVYPAMRLANYLVLACCAVADQCAQTFLVEPI